MMAPTFLKVGLLLLSQLHLTWAMILPRHQLVSCIGTNPAGAGDTCTSFASKWQLDEKFFVSLNPDINCSNLVAGQNYCVVGSFLPAPTTSPTVIPRAPATSSLASSQPQETGRIAGCAHTETAKDKETCDSFGQFGLDRAAFKALNPKINTDCTNLIAGELYCVRASSSGGSSIATSSSSSSIDTSAQTTLATVTKTTATSSGNSVPTSSMNPQPGIADNCKDHARVRSTDTCYSIAQRKGTTPDIIMKLNSGVGSKCEKLWVGYDVCVRV
ncbi:hypothetical protein J3F84DRAFT_13816 [Trichoderma pleuroticola]